MKNTNYEQMSNSELIAQIEDLNKRYHRASTHEDLDLILDEMGVL